jgi:very-short-patch-repair endonuclease
MKPVPTNSEFDVRLRKIHGNRITRLEDRVTGQVNILCRCNICGHIWKARCTRIIRNPNCPNCNLLSEKSFDQKVFDFFGDSFFRTEEFTKNMRVRGEKIQMKCKVCNLEAKYRVNHIVEGHGCRCRMRRGNEAQRVPLSEFLRRCFEIHGDKYDYSKVNYEYMNKTKVTIICPIHGEFKQLIGDHICNKSGCPKCRESKGEKKIRLYLESYNVEYIKNKRYKDCRDKNPLPFDFYIPTKNLLIEFDGEQHFNHMRFGNMGRCKDKEEYLRKIQYRDSIKTNYCLNNNIKLLRIKYTEINNIESILDTIFQ